jgi:ribose 5-phosphate isomerase B
LKKLTKLAIGSDHAGYSYKNIIAEWLSSLGYEIEDLGTYSAESCDYPDYAFRVAESVSEGRNDLGILICGTGIGMSMSANKVKGIRAATCWSVDSARLAREHNNANILAFGARLIPLDLAKEIIIAFLNSEFQQGRHLRRVKMIDEYDNV